MSIEEKVLGVIEEPIKIIAHCDCAFGGNDYLAFPIAYYYENPDGSLTGYV